MLRIRMRSQHGPRCVLKSRTSAALRLPQGLAVARSLPRPQIPAELEPLSPGIHVLGTAHLARDTRQYHMLSVLLPLPRALASGNNIVTIFPEGVSTGHFREVLLGNTRGPWSGHSRPGHLCELCGQSRPLTWGTRDAKAGPSGQERVAGWCWRSCHHHTPGWQGGGDFLRAPYLSRRESRALRLSHVPPHGGLSGQWCGCVWDGDARPLKTARTG